MVNLDNTREWFAEEMRRQMKNKGVSLTDVSKDCNIKRDKLNNYMQQRSLPGPDILIILATYFECYVNDFLDFDEPDDAELLYYEPDELFEDEDELMTHISNRMRRIMEDRRIDIAELSDITGYNAYTIRHWLGMHRRRPGLFRTFDLLVLCSALECTPSDLLGY